MTSQDARRVLARDHRGRRPRRPAPCCAPPARARWRAGSRRRARPPPRPGSGDRCCTTMMGAANPASAGSRFSVAARKLEAWPSKKRMNCLGYMARDSGHSRVPEPPDRMTGTMRVSCAPWPRAARRSISSARTPRNQRNKVKRLLLLTLTYAKSRRCRTAVGCLAIDEGTRDACILGATWSQFAAATRGALGDLGAHSWASRRRRRQDRSKRNTLASSSHRSQPVR